MSKDKYPSIFSPQMEAIVFIILQIFFATRAIFKIGEYSRSRDALKPIARQRKDLMDYKSHYTLLYKYGKQTHDFGGVFIPSLVYFSIFWGRY